MRDFLPILFFLLMALSVFGQSYRLNDTMYIWEMHGVDMIDHPSNPNEEKDRFYYSVPSRIVDTDIGKYPVSREINPGFDLQGHWVKVIIKSDTGYVFDGYLSHLSPFDLRSNGQGVALAKENFEIEGAVSKGIRSFGEGMPEEGKSRDIWFDNGIHWNMKNIQSCLIETYTCPHLRLSEAYLLMMTLYSNYFDQEATSMSEPKFLSMNGNKYEFILRDNTENRRITIYRKNGEYIISGFTCPDKMK